MEAPAEAMVWVPDGQLGAIRLGERVAGVLLVRLNGSNRSQNSKKSGREPLQVDRSSRQVSLRLLCAGRGTVSELCGGGNRATQVGARP